MAGLQAVRITKEVVYNTFPTTPAAGTQTTIFLPVDDAMTVRPDPKFWMIKDASRGNRTIKKKVGRTAVTGAISTYLFPSQAALLMNLLTHISGSGNCLNLPSFAIDHAIVRDFDCATEYRRYTGCKFGQGTLTADNTDQGCITSFRADIIGSTPRVITSTDFPNATTSALPADDAFLFYETAGHLIIGGTRTDYQNLTVTVGNVLQSFMNESIFVSSVDWFGRDVTLQSKLRYKAFADRAAYEAGTKQAVSLEFDDGTNQLLIDLQGQCNIDSLTDSLPLADYFTQNITLSSLYDSTNSSDLVVSYSGTPV